MHNIDSKLGTTHCNKTNQTFTKIINWLNNDSELNDKPMVKSRIREVFKRNKHKEQLKIKNGKSYTASENKIDYFDNGQGCSDMSIFKEILNN